MQATDLYLGFFAEKQMVTPEPFPLKSDGLLSGRSSFQSMFSQAVGSQPRAQTVNNLASANYEPREIKAPDRQQAPALRDVSHGKPKASTAAQPSAKPAQAADNSSTQGASATSNAGAAEAQAAATQDAAQTATDQASATRKMEALLDRLEQEIAKGKGLADEQLVELLMQLLALLIAGTKAAEGEFGDDASLEVALKLDPDSKLQKVLDLLMQGKEGLNAEDLKDVNILLKLTGDKGLLIPLSELIRNDAESEAGADAGVINAGADAAEEGGKMKFTLLLTDANDAAKTVELDLTITAEDMKSAQLVSLSDPALKESDLVMTIPLDRLVDTKTIAADGTSLDSLLAVLEGSDDAVRVSLVSDKEMAAQLAKEAPAQASDPVKVVLPLKPAGAEPKVLTANSMFLAADEYLKALDKEAMAKELTTTGKDRIEIFQRLQKLIFDSGTTLFRLEKMLPGKDAGGFVLKDWLQNFAGQDKQETRDWASMLKDNVAAPKPNIPTETASDRIAFLGRPASSDAFSQTLTGKAEAAARFVPAQDLQESVMQQIVQRAAYTFTNGTDGEVRVFLRPANLGDLYLKVKVEQDVVTAKITAGSHAVKAIIENNLAQLKQSLDDAGIKVGRFEVEVNTGMNEQPGNGPQDSSGDTYLADYGAAASPADAAGSYAASLDVDYGEAALYGANGDVYVSASRHSYLA